MTMVKCPNRVGGILGKYCFIEKRINKDGQKPKVSREASWPQVSSWSKASKAQTSVPFTAQIYLKYTYTSQFQSNINKKG